MQLQVSRKAVGKAGATICEIEGLTWKGERDGKDRLRDIRLNVRKGEVVGVAGVEGNGQSELLHALLRPKPLAQAGILSGRLSILGEDCLLRSTAEIRSRGVGFVPEDRHREALLLESPLTENYLLGRHRAPEFCSRGSFLKIRRVNEATGRAIRDYDVRPANP